MIQTLIFPKGQGLMLTAEVTENEDKSVTISDFILTVGEFSRSFKGGTFQLKPHEIVYATNSGLKAFDTSEGSTNAYPTADDRFPNGSCYWIVARLTEDLLQVLEVA